MVGASKNTIVSGTPKEPIMNRRLILATLIAAIALPEIAAAQSRSMPNAEQIIRRLEGDIVQRRGANQRVTVQEFKRRPDLRRAAPSIDIQAINFAFGSADIPYSQYGKVEELADAIDVMSRRRQGVRFLLEGHTDAVGSYESNQVLSERRAESLKRLLVREFGISPRVLETVGYGEEYLLVQTPYEDWRNRRVTLRRIDAFVR